MLVRLWIDPVCPFCWMTSRWLLRVAPARDLTVDWQPISLLRKNRPEPDHRFFASMTHSHGLLRVMEAVRADGQADRLGALYTEFGRWLHVRREPRVDLPSALVAAGLSATFASALDQESLDEAIAPRMAAGLALVGDDVGTPIIAVPASPDAAGAPDPTVAGDWVGLFGPVITTLPGEHDALRLWDGFLAMAHTPGFFELKRTRTVEPDRLDESDL